MKALILAAGFGIRLREVIHGRPKHLANVNGKPFLQHVIELLHKHNISDIVIAVGYLSERIVAEFGDGAPLGVSINYSVDDRPLGTAGTIKHAEKYFTQDFLVINGDTYIDIDFQALLQFHKKNQAEVTIVATSKFHGKGGSIQVKGNRVTAFSNTGVGTSKFENAGVYIFSPSALKRINKYERVSLENNLFPKMITAGRPIFAFKVDKPYIDIGTPQHLQEAIKKLPPK